MVGQDEAQRAYNVRRDAPQDFALLQCLAHQAEVQIFEIAQPAMDQLGGGGDVAEARSFISQRNTDQPRPAASRAMPQPLTPPPMMAMS